MLNEKEEDLFRKLWDKKFPDLNKKHARIRGYKWTLMKFKKSEFYPSLGKLIRGENGNLISKLGRLYAEIISDGINKRKTTIHPVHRLNSKHLENPIKCIIEKNNILLLVGLEESSKRDTNNSPQTTTGVKYTQWGTDGTAESESQTGVITAYGSRFDLDTHGQRKTVSQTSKYNDTADDADLTVPVTLKEAALYNQSPGGIAHVRIQFPDFNLIAGEVITAQINELMKNLV